MSLDICLSQNINLSQNLQQSLSLLRLSSLEIEDYIDEQISKNPLLVKRVPTRKAENIHWEDFTPAKKSLKTHLMDQVPLLEEGYRGTATDLVGCVNEDGYLKDWKSVECSDEKLQKVIDAMQETFSPSGICARDPWESIEIQLKEKKLCNSLTKKVLEELSSTYFRVSHLDNLIKKLAHAISVDKKEVEKCFKSIRSCKINLGAEFESDQAQSIIPEMILASSDGNSVVKLAEDFTSGVNLDRFLYRSWKDSSEKGFGTYAKHARDFVYSLKRRYTTMIKVAQAIFNHQNLFLEYGSIKPLSLEEVGRELNIHQSTVSRATVGKYIDTPFGTFEMSYFFSRATPQSITSVHTAKKAILQFISSEDKAEPLSDFSISDLLKKRYSINLARRTVAKYREAMKIKPSRERVFMN